MKEARGSAPGQGGGWRGRAPLLVAAVLVVGVAGLVGWLASQPPLPDAIPYYVSLPSPPDGAEEAEPQRDVFGARAKTVHSAPHPSFVEDGPYGLVPVIAPDGRQSWQIYASPYDDGDPRPRVAVVLSGLGKSRADTTTALALPAEVTLAFSPYAEGLEEWAREARAAGHELLLEVPMEPARPADDPGPRALLTSLGPNQNLDRLAWSLARFTGYVGVIEAMGGGFTTSARHLEPILGEFKRRGLLYVDRHAHANALPRTIAEELGLLRIGADIDVDAEPSRREIAKRLASAAALARQNGTAVVVARPLPVTFELLNGWFDRLDADGIALAPITAVTARRAGGPSPRRSGSGRAGG